MIENVTRNADKNLTIVDCAIQLKGNSLERTAYLTKYKQQQSYLQVLTSDTFTNQKYLISASSEVLEF